MTTHTITITASQPFTWPGRPDIVAHHSVHDCDRATAHELARRALAELPDGDYYQVITDGKLRFGMTCQPATARRLAPIATTVGGERAAHPMTKKEQQRRCP